MATTITPHHASPGETAPGRMLYEVVNGQVEEKPPADAFRGEVTSLLLGYLAPFVRTHHLGRVVGHVLFRVSRTPDLQRRPSVAFISDVRWPRTRRAPKEEAWDVVPDLTAEVITPADLAAEVVAKVGAYFRAGVRSVWVIYPDYSLVYIYQSPEDLRILGATDTLDGGDILPGFRLPLARLFEAEAE